MIEPVGCVMLPSQLCEPHQLLGACLALVVLVELAPGCMHLTTYCGPIIETCTFQPAGHASGPQSAQPAVHA